MLRNRKPTTAFESVKQLDAFQKLPDEDLRSSCLGGTSNTFFYSIVKPQIKPINFSHF